MIQDLTAFTMTASIDLIETSFAGLTFRSFWSKLSFWQKRQKYLLGWKKSLIWCENWKRIFIWELNLFSFWSPMLSQNSDESMILGGVFPGNPGIKTPSFQHRERMFSPWSGSKDPTCHVTRPKKKKDFMSLNRHSDPGWAQVATELKLFLRAGVLCYPGM